MLGQEIKDGALKEGPSFIGNISRVNMWDYVLSMEDVNRMSTNCSSPAGNVVKWRDFRNGLQGRVVLRESSQCVGAGKLKLQHDLKCGLDFTKILKNKFSSCLHKST